MMNDCVLSWRITEKGVCGRIFEKSRHLSCNLFSHVASLFLACFFLFLLGSKKLVMDCTICKKTVASSVQHVMEKMLNKINFWFWKEALTHFLVYASHKRILTFIKQFSLANLGWKLTLFMDCIVVNFCTGNILFLWDYNLYSLKSLKVRKITQGKPSWMQLFWWFCLLSADQELNIYVIL